MRSGQAAAAAVTAAMEAADTTIDARDAAQVELRCASQELHAAMRSRAARGDELLALRSHTAETEAKLAEAQAEVRLPGR